MRTKTRLKIARTYLADNGFDISYVDEGTIRESNGETKNISICIIKSPNAQYCHNMLMYCGSEGDSLVVESRDNNHIALEYIMNISECIFANMPKTKLMIRYI